MDKFRVLVYKEWYDEELNNKTNLIFKSSVNMISSSNSFSKKGGEGEMFRNISKMVPRIRVYFK